MSEGFREVEVAVAYGDYTWEKLWIEIPENPNYVLDDPEIRDAARKLVLRSSSAQNRNVFFIHIIYIKPPDDCLEWNV